MIVKMYDDWRKLSVGPPGAVLGVEGDVGSKEVAWDVPRRCGDVDVSELRLQVHYVNADGDGDCSEAQGLEVGDDRMKFTWRVPPLALAKAGRVEAAFVARGEDCEYKSAKGQFEVLGRLPEQDPAGAALVDHDGNVVVVQVEGGE